MFVTALTSVAKEKLLSTLIPVRCTTKRQEKSANKGTTQLAELALLESYTFPFWQLGICTLPKRILNRLMSALGRLRLAPQVHIFQTLGIVCLDTSHSHGQEQSDQPCQSEDILEMPLSLKYDPNVPYNLACPACPRHWSLQRWSASPPRCAVRGECMATEELFPPRNEAAECEDLAWLEGHGMAMLTSTVKDECFFAKSKTKGLL